MAYSTYHRFLSMQAAQAHAQLSMYEALHPPAAGPGPLPLPLSTGMPSATSGPLSLLLLGDDQVEEIDPARLPTNVYCRGVDCRYRHLVTALRTTPDLRKDVDTADVIVLAYGRDDLARVVLTAQGNTTMPIPSRMVTQEAEEAIRELRTTSTKPGLSVYCMEALPMLHWTGERRLAAGMLVDQIAAAPCCNGVITSAWCPDAFIQPNGDLTPQGYKAWAQQLHTLMWRVQGSNAW